MIHQLYITHCTYGSSYFSSETDKTPEQASVPLGYSVRSASAEKEEARKIYTAIESQMYYHLPSDGSASDIDALKAPRRFFYLPSVDGKPVIGCAAYRKEDTAGRPGSYFAHVLYGDGEKPWMSRTVLQMYKSNFWRGVDGADIPDSLPTIDMDSVTSLTDGSPISDSVFENWISGKTEWKTAVNGEEIVVRPEQFELFFAGAMSVWKDATKKIILVADSDTAALFYYGILRLAPGGWGTHAAFSTYESAPMDFPGRLCATTFVNPMKNDLSSEMYAGHFVFNVFTGRHSSPGPKTNPIYLPALPGESVQYPLTDKGECSYAQTIVNRLKINSWAGVSALQQLSAAMNLKVGGNPDSVIATEFVLTHQIGLSLRIMAEGNPTDVGYLNRAFSSDITPIWRQNKSAAELLQKQLSQGITQLDITKSNVADKLKLLIGTQAHLMILELLGTQSSDEKTNLVVLHLLNTLPTELVGPWLTFGNASESAQITMILRHIGADGQLPPGAEKKIFEGTQSALLAKLLVKLDSAKLGALWNRYVGQYRLSLISALTQSVAYHGGEAAFLDNIIEKLSLQDLIDLYRFGSDRYYSEYPTSSSSMGKKLEELSTQFESFLPEFDDYIQTLSAGSHLMSEDKSQQASSWTSFKATAQSILELQGDGTGNVDSLDDLMRKLVLDFSVAAPEKEAQIRAPEKRKLFLQNVIAALFPSQNGFKQFLPPITPRNELLWKKTIAFFENGQWQKNKPSISSFIDRIVSSRSTTVNSDSPDVTEPDSLQTKNTKGKFKLNKTQSMYLSVALGAFLLITALVLVNLDLFTSSSDNGQTGEQNSFTSADNNPSRPELDTAVQSERQKESKALESGNKTHIAKDSDITPENTDSEKAPQPIIWDDAPEYGDKYETKPEQNEMNSMLDTIEANLKKNPDVIAKLASIPSKTDLEIESIKNSLREPMLRVKGKAYSLPTNGIERPLDENGSLDLVKSGLIDSLNIPNLKLGPGFFVFHDKVIRWGAGDVFDPQNPVTQYRLTDLEKALGLEECYVSLVTDAPSTIKMVLSVKGKKVHFDKNDKQKTAADLEKRKLEYNDLGYELREYNRSDVPENAKKKRVYRMGVMVGIPIAESVPSSPNKKDYKTEAEFQTAVENQRVAAEAYERQRKLVVDKANEVYKWLEKEIERLTNLEAVEQQSADVQAQNNLKNILKHLKQSAFILYRPNGFTGQLSLSNTDILAQPETINSNADELQPDALSVAEPDSDNQPNNDIDPFAETGAERTSNVQVQKPNAASVNQEEDIDEAAKPLEPVIKNDINNNASNVDIIDDSEDDVIEDPFAEPTEQEKPQAVRIKPRHSTTTNRPSTQPEGTQTDKPTSKVNELNKSALMFKDDKEDSPLAGIWSDPTIKPAGVMRSGVISLLTATCRNAGASKDTSSYNRFRSSFQKHYAIECQLVQISVSGKRTISNFMVATSGPLAKCEFDIIPQTVSCSVKFRFTNKDNPEKVFETNWGTIKNIEEKKQYTIFYELAPGDMEMMLAQ